jgi:predicted XRE-type DNA-binding protein
VAHCLDNDTGRTSDEDSGALGFISRHINTAEITTLGFVFGGYQGLVYQLQKSGHHPVKNVKCAHQIVRTAAHLLENWPHNFNSFLREAGKFDEPRRISEKMPKQFLSFSKALRSTFRLPGLEFALREYRTFMTENWKKVLTRRNTWALPENLLGQRYIAGGTVAKLLRISQNRVAELLSQNILHGYIEYTKTGREIALIERTSIENAELYFHDQIAPSHAARLLGISKQRVDALIEAGILNSSIKKDRLKPTVLMSRSEITEFIEKITGESRICVDENDLLDGAAILRAHLASNREFVAFVSAIISKDVGTVIPISTKYGFTGLHFSRHEFMQWRSSLRKGETEIQLSVVDIAARLGVKQEVAYHLVRIGLIRSKSGVIGRRECRLVQVPDLEQFESMYVSCSSLAKASATSPKRIVESLRLQGVHPIAGPSVDRCRQYFFKKTDVYTD